MGNIDFLTVAFWLSMFGALIAIGCYLPGVIKVFKYKDTRSISILMFSLTTFGCFLWIVIGIFLIIGNIQNYYSHNKEITDIKELIKPLASGIGTIISNIGLGSCSAMILIKKMINVSKAKKLNMTEDEYYKKVVEPSMKRKK